jgi:four helix bundle protein
MEYANSLDDRLLDFASSILNLTEKMPKSLTGRRISDQLIRSGTSVGANYEEATGAESKADFIHKMRIAFKEAREACYWLRLIERSQMLLPDLIQPVLKESLEIRAVLGKSITTLKNKTETMQLCNEELWNCFALHSSIVLRCIVLRFRYISGMRLTSGRGSGVDNPYCDRYHGHSTSSRTLTMQATGTAKRSPQKPKSLAPAISEKTIITGCKCTVLRMTAG